MRKRAVYLSSPVYFVNIAKRIVLKVHVNHREDTIAYKNDQFKIKNSPYRLRRAWNSIKSYTFLDTAASMVHDCAKLYNSYKWLSDHLKNAPNKIIKTTPKHDYKVSKFTYNKETKTFVAEASELDILIPKLQLSIYNPKTNKAKTFYRTKADQVEDEISGWNFKTNDGIKLLIIND